MFDWYKYDIIDKINARKNPKVVIGLGDSFTQGHGACSTELWEKCNWDVNSVPNTMLWDYQIQFYENSWVNQICKNHLIDYIPINMGMNGRGNRAAAKELYLHPDLKLEDVREKIVIFMLSGSERFDFVHKNYFEHIHFNTIWPNFGSKVPEKSLWEAYAEHIWSEKSSIIELLLSVAEVKTWCKLNNATLILTSAFRPEYNREYFIEQIRGSKDEKDNYLYHRLEYVESLVDIIDWENFLRPKGFQCFSDYLCSLEGREDLIQKVTESKFFQYAKSLEKLSPNGYITNCAHPSDKAHKDFAEIIFEHLINVDKNIIKNNRLNGKKILTNII